MKELSIEEKAKAYDEAIKRAKVFKEHLLEIDEKDYADEMDYVFPALKESEDEKIRKELLNFVQNERNCMDSSVKPENSPKLRFLIDAIAWLEKQGKNNMGISETTKQNLEDNLNKALEKETPESCNEFLEKQYSQILANSAKTCKDEQKPAWSEEDEKMYALTLLSLARFMGNGDKIDWLKSLKDRVQPQPKQDWSEEDEKMLSDIIKDLVHPWNEYIPDRIEEEIKWLKNKLKSLKERYTWKPSEEQMKALKEAVDEHFDIDDGALWHLYEDLKKLNIKSYGR